MHAVRTRSVRCRVRRPASNRHASRSQALDIEATYLIDATTVELNGLSKIWAQDKKRDGAAAKMHIVYECARKCKPVHFDVSPVRTNEIAIAKAMSIEPGATYVFDMGYYDFELVG